MLIVVVDYERGVGVGAREEAKTRGDGMKEKPQREAGRASARDVDGGARRLTNGVFARLGQRERGDRGEG